MADNPDPPKTLTPSPPSSERGQALARLRAELESATERSRQGRLLVELAELEEMTFDDVGAARDYLAAFNADPLLRESLEGLVRLLERRRSRKNLARLLEALVRAASNPDEKLRALHMRGTFLEDLGEDREGAETLLKEATTVPVEDGGTAAAWLALELLAAKTGNDSLARDALLARARGEGDPEWQALLLRDAALTLGPREGLPLLDDALALRSRASYLVNLAREELARGKGPEESLARRGEEDGPPRATAFALAAEASADWILASLRDGERGDALGLPRAVRSHAHAVDAWLRAADAFERAGDTDRAASILDRALEALTGVEPLTIPLLDARIRLAERAGDSGRVSELAERRLAIDEGGAEGAVLAMKVAHEAAKQGNLTLASRMVATAVAVDPSCLPARALQFELLARNDDMVGTANELESFAEELPSEEARGGMFLLAAYVWGAHAGDISHAKAALTQAGMYGVPKETLARVARFMARTRNDALWMEDATRGLIATFDAQTDDSGADPEERASLWFDLVRSKLTRGDLHGVRAAVRELSETEGGAWLGNALLGVLPLVAADAPPSSSDPDASTSTQRARDRLVTWENLSRLEPRSNRAVGLTIAEAMVAQSLGDIERATERLSALSRKHPGDPLVASYLVGLHRASGNGLGAANVLAHSAASVTDPQLAQSFSLQAGFLKWKNGDRLEALEAFKSSRQREKAAAGEDTSAAVTLALAARASLSSTSEGRREALGYAAEAGEPSPILALQRFAAELCGGDSETVSASLRTLEAESGAFDDFPLAGALGRLLWDEGEEDRDALDRSIARLWTAGGSAKRLAASETLRLAREKDPAAALDAAEAWFDHGGGLLAGLEWWGAAMASRSPGSEAKARLAIAELFPDDEGATQQLRANAAMFGIISGGSAPPIPFLKGDHPATHLANFELSPPGCDPRRRAVALIRLDDAYRAGSAAVDDRNPTSSGNPVSSRASGDVGTDALALAAWSLFASGQYPRALTAFTHVTRLRPTDLAAWEGLRSTARSLGDAPLHAEAALELGRRVHGAERSAAFFEEAALLFVDAARPEEAEAAFSESFLRDPKRPVAFDRLFRMVRETKDAPRLLELIDRRLTVTDDPLELSKLFWEQARALRGNGDYDAALQALENVTMIEPEHVGALALTGEIFIRRGMYQEAAEKLALLSTLPEAPEKNRLTAGLAAADLYETRLDRLDLSLEVLVNLHRAKLSTLPVRERLARAAARVGNWTEATAILEELMLERPTAEGRMEAARLAMAIHRDRIQDPASARIAVSKLLEEAPGDGEAIDLFFQLDVPREEQVPHLERMRTALLSSLAENPLDHEAMERLARVTNALNDSELNHASLALLAALTGDASVAAATTQWGMRKPRLPRVALTPALLSTLMAKGDEGPLARLFQLLAPTLTDALGPSLEGLKIIKRDRVDPRSGLSLRNEIAAWAGAMGLANFDLYVGGRDPNLIQGVPGEVPTLVVGADINAPLTPPLRARIARELWGLMHGTSILRSRDETAIAAIVTAAFHIAEVPLEAPSYAILAEVERLMNRAISRKARRALPDACKAVLEGGEDARAWARRARMSMARVAVVASGEVATALSDLLDQDAGGPRADDERRNDLVRFVLSSDYVLLRRHLGLEGGS